MDEGKSEEFLAYDFFTLLLGQFPISSPEQLTF
jgi:hypothetical protein